MLKLEVRMEVSFSLETERLCYVKKLVCDMGVLLLVWLTHTQDREEQTHQMSYLIV